MKKNIILIALILFTVFLLNACMTHKDAPAIKHYSLSTKNLSAQNSSSEKTNNQNILRIMPVSIETEFAGKSFVYRMSDSQYIEAPYHQFLVAPNLQVTKLIYEYLSTSSTSTINAVVTNGNSLLLANYALQLNIKALYADYRSKSLPKAVTVIDAHLYKITHGTAEIIGTKTFTESHYIILYLAQSQ